VGGIGLLMMSISLDVAWIICLATVGALVGATLFLKKIDVRSSPRPVLSARSEQGTHIA
jgi:hypothetical protein